LNSTTEMKTIYLIRHAESEFNLAHDQGLCDDRKDSDLTSTGEDQAKQLGKDLSEIQFDLILVSPLKRAQRTYELSNLHGDKYLISNLIREYRTDPCDFLDTEPIVLETQTEIQTRIDQIKDYLQSCSGQMIALVSHADLIWHLTAEDHDGETYGEWLANADYTIINM
jgi:broad specificity phosphatase PhoE